MANQFILITDANDYIGSCLFSSLNISSTLLEDGMVGLVTDIRVQFIPERLSVGATIGFSTVLPNPVGVGTTVGIGSETAQILNIFRDDSALRIRRSLGVSTSGIVGLGLSYFSNQIEFKVNI